MKRIRMIVMGGVLSAAAILGLGGSTLVLFDSAAARATEVAKPGMEISPGLALPAFHPEEGKKLFAAKGCVVCHAVNGVGGTDAPSLDASTMEPVMSPFDFFAKMWNHSPGMIAMQQNELGGQIMFTGQEIADIIAFLHDPALQKTFTEDDIPPEVAEHMEKGGMGEGHGMENMGTMMNGEEPKDK